jgi:hypothetical protein
MTATVHLHVVSKCKIPRALYLGSIHVPMAWQFATLENTRRSLRYSLFPFSGFQH